MHVKRVFKYLIYIAYFLDDALAYITIYLHRFLVIDDIREK